MLLILRFLLFSVTRPRDWLPNLVVAGVVFSLAAVGPQIGRRQGTIGLRGRRVDTPPQAHIPPAALVESGRSQGRARYRITPRGLVYAGALVALASVWFTTLHPQALGGPTSYLIVAGHSMEPTLHVGDLALIVRQPAYEVGDIVAYRVPVGHAASGERIIHRITGITGDRFAMQGDNVNGPDLWQPAASDIEGRLWFYIPNGGRVALLLRHPTILPALLAAVTVAVMIKRMARHEPGLMPVG